METQKTLERKKAYVEILEILKRVDKKLVDKIPQKLIDFLNKNKDEEYYFKYDDTKRLKEQKLSSITLDLLGMLDLNYWCENEEEKQKLIKKYSEKEKKYQDELREKYNPDNIFEKRKVDTTPVAENMQIAEYKEPTWYKKIFEKILSIFKRN